MDLVTVLPLRFVFESIDSFIYPAVLQDDYGITLIDCGYPGFLPNIESALVQAGFQMKDLKRIIITHHDHDHMGALKELVDKYPEIEVMSSKAQKPFITGNTKSLRLLQAEEIDQYLSDAEKVESKKFMDLLNTVQSVDYVTEVSDGEILPICGGVEVIDTSGHMPGHISLFVPLEKTLIVGDALVIEDGVLCIANPEYALDMSTAIDSIKKLLNFDIERVICYHGGIYSGDIKSELLRILNENSK